MNTQKKVNREGQRCQCDMTASDKQKCGLVIKEPVKEIYRNKQVGKDH